MPASFPLCQRKTFFHHFSLFSLFSLSLSRSSRANLPGKNPEWATASSQTRPRSSSAQPGASTSRTRPEGRGSRRQARRRSMAVAASSPFTTGAPARPCGASPVGSPCRRGRSRQRYEILVALDCRSEYASLFLPAGERGKEKGSDSQSWSQKKNSTSTSTSTKNNQNSKTARLVPPRIRPGPRRRRRRRHRQHLGRRRRAQGRHRRGSEERTKHNDGGTPTLLAASGDV